MNNILNAAMQWQDEAIQCRTRYWDMYFPREARQEKTIEEASVMKQKQIGVGGNSLGITTASWEGIEMVTNVSRMRSTKIW
jgi:hypothetical protein